MILSCVGIFVVYDPRDDMEFPVDSDLPTDNDPMTPEDSDTDEGLYTRIYYSLQVIYYE